MPRNTNTSRTSTRTRKKTPQNRIGEFISDTRGTSPSLSIVLVSAFVLMSSIVLAGPFALSVVDGSAITAPEHVNITYEYNETTDQLVITHAGGDDIHPATSIDLYLDTTDDPPVERNAPLYRTGYEAAINNASNGDRVIISWKHPDHGTGILDEYEIDHGPSSELSIENVNAPGTLNEGDAFTADVTINNTGDKTGHGNVTVSAFHVEFDDVNVESLAPGESDTVTLTWEDAGEHPGTYELLIETSDDHYEHDLNVLGDASLDIISVSSWDTAYEGTPYNVTVGIENTGDELGGGEITFEIDGVGIVDEKPVTVESGDREYVTVSWSETTGNNGEYTGTINTGDSIENIEFIIEEYDDEE